MIVAKFFPAVALAATLLAQTPLFPLQDVRPGLTGVGRTVFSGNRVAEFQVRILGVLHNAGPKQSIILARLSGGPLAQTGVLEGMSGSPVYIDGRLVGAVALGFPFSKEAIAGIRPIGDMLRSAPAAGRPGRVRVSLWDRRLTGWFPRRESFPAGGARLTWISTPLSFSGFTAATIRHFAGELREIGLEPRQAVSGGGTLHPGLGNPASLHPGSMISVLLLAGDMSIGADGTVTLIRGRRIYAFGHRFLSVGRTELPFTRSEVLALAPNLNSSFKISATRETLGTITADYSTAISGLLGRRAATVPLEIRVQAPPDGAGRRRVIRYHMEMARDRFLDPFLLQMAVYSAIDATQRTLGTASVGVRGRIEFQGGLAPVRLADMYAGAGNIPQQASLATAIPLAYALQSGFDTLRLKRVSLAIDVYDRKRFWRIDRVQASPARVRPGGTVELSVVLVGDNGAQQVRHLRYRVPIGAPAGKLHFTVADAATTNLTEYLSLVGVPLHSPRQVISLLNHLRPNTGAYVRVWRAASDYRVRGRNLPEPPPSVALILGGAAAARGEVSRSRNSKVAERVIRLGDAVVSGSQTIQVEVKP